MNDRFKFRVWNKLSNVMSYEVCFGNFFQRTKLEKEVFDWVSVSYGDNYISYRGDALKELEIMQCTGLKDKNGTLIYEGDILGGTFGNLYIHYCDNCKQFQLKANDYGCMACEGDIHWYELVEAEEQNKLEVIGNIYENKELLESEEQTDEK